MRDYVVAIVGASGAVGEEIAKVLEEQNFPIKKLVPLASLRSAGKTMRFRGKDYTIQESTDEVFAQEGVEIAFFSAGGSVSERFAPSAVNANAIVIDNTSFFRMQDDVPLVVPEVNSDDIFTHKGIIANPNCSTIQMVQVLAPLHKAFGIRRVDVATYQAVSGAGKKGMDALLRETKEQLDGKNAEHKSSVFPYSIAFNLFPHIDIFLDNDYTKEEVKMIKETQKIMHSDFEVSATCVRVPVLRSHSEAISIKFDSEVSAESARAVLEKAENVVVIDNVKNLKYPMPIIASNTDSTFVGRIRSDCFDKKILHLFCVADQIRVGAATNAVRIAQKLMAEIK